MSCGCNNNNNNKSSNKTSSSIKLKPGVPVEKKTVVSESADQIVISSAINPASITPGCKEGPCATIGCSSPTVSESTPVPCCQSKTPSTSSNQLASSNCLSSLGHFSLEDIEKVSLVAFPIVKTIGNSKAVPSCNNSVTLEIEPTENAIPRGSYLFGSGYGYFEVLAHDNKEGSIVIKNNCEDCADQIPAGSPIPPCTSFIITGKPCSGGNTIIDEGYYLCTSFYTPAYEASITIEIALNGVKTNAGILPGSIVFINGYGFTVVSLIGTTAIQIKNETLSNPVNARIEAGENCGEVKISFRDFVSPCSQPSVNTFVPVGCKNGELRISTPPSPGMYQRSKSNGEVEWAFAPNEVECFSLASCLTISGPAEEEEIISGIIEISPETDVFINKGDCAVGLIITINGEEFRILEVIDNSHLEVEPVFNFTGIKKYNPGVPVCVADCCDQCPITIETASKRSLKPVITIGDIKNLTAIEGANNKRYFGPQTLDTINLVNNTKCRQFYKITYNIKAGINIDFVYSGSDDSLKRYFSATHDYHLRITKSGDTPSPFLGSRFTHSMYESDRVSAATFPSGFIGNNVDLLSPGTPYFSNSNLFYQSGDVSNWITLDPNETAQVELLFRGQYVVNTDINLADWAATAGNNDPILDVIVEVFSGRECSIAD